MRPMDKSSTRFMKYHEIQVDKTDLFEDAMRFRAEFHDVFEILDRIKVSPGKRLNSRLMQSIRKENNR